MLGPAAARTSVEVMCLDRSFQDQFRRDLRAAVDTAVSQDAYMTCFLQGFRRLAAHPGIAG